MGIHPEVEREVRSRCDASDYASAAGTVVREFGPEIFGFLLATHRAEQDASDVFSDFSMATVRGLPSFRWESSLRTWLYALARNASHRFRRDASRRVGERGRASISALEDVAQKVRTATLSLARTQTRTRLEQLRDELSPEDRELLVLRVDRGLAWDDLVLAFHEGDSTLDDASRARESQRLRKRFQIVKERLREMARRDGLVE
jgi:RNA polymerase sigma-70 factor (ECF subfamily)